MFETVGLAALCVIFCVCRYDIIIDDNLKPWLIEVSRAAEINNQCYVDGLTLSTFINDNIPTLHDVFQTVRDTTQISRLLFSNRKLHTGFRLVPKVVTLNDL